MTNDFIISVNCHILETGQLLQLLQLFIQPVKLNVMILRKLDNVRIALSRSFMNPTERQILKSVLKHGRSYPGDVLRDLRISPSLGLQKIINLRHKGYLIRENESSTVRINPDKRRFVKIVTSGV